MNDDDNGCMLKEITGFLIKVGEHCLNCEGEHKTMEMEKPIEASTIIKFKSKPKLEAEYTYHIPTQTTPIKEKPKKTHKHNVKKSYLEKWIQDNNFTVFTLDMFYSKYPKQKENRKLDGIISRLISDGKILQLGKDKFTVI